MMQKSRWEDTKTCTSIPDVTSLSILPHQNRKKAEMTIKKLGALLDQEN